MMHTDARTPELAVVAALIDICTPIREDLLAP
jgi:hypothetical protein